jgi:hypothetical protein
MQVAYWQKQFGLAPPAKQPEVHSLGLPVSWSAIGPEGLWDRSGRRSARTLNRSFLNSGSRFDFCHSIVDLIPGEERDRGRMSIRF